MVNRYVLGAEEVDDDDDENDRPDDVDDVALAHSWFLLVVRGRPSQLLRRSRHIFAWQGLLPCMGPPRARLVPRVHGMFVCLATV